jgi:nitroreductase
MNELTEVIKKRRSVRKFEPKPISEEIIKDILDCARLAPTAINIQPWLFGAVTDPFADSAQKYFLEDGCAATENILLACAAHGIGSCWVAGHKKVYVDSIRKLLKVPEPYTLIALIAAGYSKEQPSPKKKTLDEVTFFNKVAR